MNSYDFEFWTDPITKKNHFKFGNELVAKAGSRPPLDWEVGFDVADRKLFLPKASSMVVGAGLIAQTQQDVHGQLIASYFNITSALGEVINAKTAQEIAAIGARLELGWVQLRSELERAKYRP